MTRSFSDDGLVASITRLQTRSGNRNRRIYPDDIVTGASAALAPGETRRLGLTLRVCLQSNSVGADLCIRAFLEAGVLGDLARAALRRVWSLDPAIATLWSVGDSWDFNAPGGMSGFGPIDGQEVGRLLTRLLREPDTIAAAGSACHIAADRDFSEASRWIRSC